VFLLIKDGVTLEVLYRPQSIEIVETVGCDYRYILHPQETCIVIVGTDGCDVIDTLLSSRMYDTDKQSQSVSAADDESHQKAYCAVRKLQQILELAAIRATGHVGHNTKNETYLL
jgi:hypothetical protein